MTVQHVDVVTAYPPRRADCRSLSTERPLVDREYLLAGDLSPTELAELDIPAEATRTLVVCWRP